MILFIAGARGLDMMDFVLKIPTGMLQMLLSKPEEELTDAYYTLRVDLSDKQEWTLWHVGTTSMQAINGSHKTPIVPDYARAAWQYGLVGGYKSPIWALLDKGFNVISFLTE